MYFCGILGGYEWLIILAVPLAIFLFGYYVGKNKATKDFLKRDQQSTNS